MRTRSKSEELPAVQAREFDVLVALADGPKHGYAILKDIEGRARGRLRLNVSTLYGAIHRLEGCGWIAESKDRPGPALDDSRRRYYRLTRHGREVAWAETERLRALVSTARARLSPAENTVIGGSP